MPRGLARLGRRSKQRVIVTTQPEFSVEEVVRRAIAAACHLNVEDVRADMAFEDLGLESMVLVAVTSRIEVECRTEFLNHEMVSLLKTREIGELATLASRFIGAKRGDSRGVGAAPLA
jgi:hypothetical protein